MMRLFFILFSLFLLLLACNNQEQVLDDFKLDLGKEYFPLKVGQFAIYQVDSIIFDPVGEKKIDTTSFQVKEEIVSYYEAPDKKTIFIMERYERKDVSENWRITNVWSVYFVNNTLIRVEDNLRFVKLIFPVVPKKTWNPNANFDDDINITVAGETLKMFKDWIASVEKIEDELIINGLVFKDIAKILPVNNENLIEYRYGIEQYAKNIGLIYRELWILDTQRIDPTLPWEQKAEKGFILKQEIIAHN
jgi:hypothetical protein